MLLPVVTTACRVVFFCSLPYLPIVSIMVHVSVLGFTGLQCTGVGGSDFVTNSRFITAMTH